MEVADCGPCRASFGKFHKVLHHPLIKIFTSQVCVTIGGHHLKNTVVDGQQGNIEGAASQVVDQDVLLLKGGLT